MEKKRLKIALAAKSIFPETQEFIENTLREECEKEKMIADERFFFCKFRSKTISLDKHFCFRFGTTTKCDFIILSQVNEISLMVNEFY